MDEKLKPCPACGGPAIRGLFVTCADELECFLGGPVKDLDGAKWNALPRRTDAPAGMSDGELIARTLVQLGVAVMNQLRKPNETHVEAVPGRLQEMDDLLMAEFDRRAAARKEATK